MELEWIDEPVGVGTGERRTEAFRMVEQLRKRPGEWAIVKRAQKKSTVQSAASQMKKRYPDCEFLWGKEDEQNFVVSGRMKLHNPGSDA